MRYLRAEAELLYIWGADEMCSSMSLVLVVVVAVVVGLDDGVGVVFCCCRKGA